MFNGGMEKKLYYPVAIQKPHSPTTGVNFINILRAAFLYKSFMRSYFVLEVKVKLFTGTRILVQLR
jgi:hypothetical protein